MRDLDEQRRFVVDAVRTELAYRVGKYREHIAEVIRVRREEIARQCDEFGLRARKDPPADSGGGKDGGTGGGDAQPADGGAERSQDG
jgi:hypothetical protein